MYDQTFYFLEPRQEPWDQLNKIRIIEKSRENYWETNQRTQGVHLKFNMEGATEFRDFVNLATLLLLKVPYLL
jgi:hypothetical protein